MFYSTGRREPPGVGEKGFEEWFTKEFGNFDFRIFDDNVFFEDKETANAVKKLIENPSNV
jgi:hypothetical protein